jgi:hypothetical protein
MTQGSKKDYRAQNIETVILNADRGPPEAMTGGGVHLGSFLLLELDI